MSRPTFHIIEGKSKDVDYESFKEDYMNMYISRKEMLEKYDLSVNRYLKLGKRVYKDTGFKRRRGVSVITPYTNIRLTTDGGYRIDKLIDGKRLYGGTYESIDKAREVRDYLIKHNWDANAIEHCIKGKGV